MNPYGDIEEEDLKGHRTRIPERIFYSIIQYGLYKISDVVGEEVSSSTNSKIVNKFHDSWWLLLIVKLLFSPLSSHSL